MARVENRWLDEGRGPSMYAVNGHQRELGRKQRSVGRFGKGLATHRDLRDHIDGMRNDRARKVASSIVAFALNLRGNTNGKGEVYPPADVLLIESLAGLIPDTERQRGINKALVNFQRGKIVDHRNQMCDDLGLRLFELHAYGTSQVCSRCGTIGRRYEVSKRGIVFGPVAKLFACPKCDYRANSDHNASFNLHRVYGDSSWINEYRAYTNLSDTKKRTRRDELDAALRPSLESLHRVGEFADVPW